jgi:hypothetical protein
MDLLSTHIDFIEQHYSLPVQQMPSNIGWVCNKDSILSKMYKEREFVETKVSEDGKINHRVYPMS